MSDRPASVARPGTDRRIHGPGELGTSERLGHEMLSMVTHQTSDLIIVTDAAELIVYVNPAFEDVSGYKGDDIIGMTPRILQSGRQSAAFYDRQRDCLIRGETWRGSFCNRRADGTLFFVDATVSLIRDAAGQPDGYLAVERDVTGLHDARSILVTRFRERAVVTAALDHLRTGGRVEDTAADICDALIGLPGIDVVVIYHVIDRRRVIPLAVRGPGGLPMARGRPMPSAQAAHLHDRATGAPWAEQWSGRVIHERHRLGMEGLGPLRMIYAPIRDGDRVNGLVALGTLGQTHRHHVADDFATVAEFAATAHALLGAQLADDRELSRRRAVIKKVIATSAFYPVFQPIVELESGTTVGFEALTRFIDGTAPALRFAEASMVDLGADLEVATLEAAIMVAPGLPSGVWLSVNVAPQLLLDSERLRSVLARSTRPLVIEITEHEVIRDYREFRQAILDLDGTIRTAVDDAGVGIANFAHIVELRADFVKLDASLIRGINLDHGRQALVAAMHHFTQSAGGQLIAEGIETAAEAGALASLQVRLGQGYFLGPPATIDALARGRATSQKPGGRRPAIAAGKRPKRLRPGAAARSG